MTDGMEDRPITADDVLRALDALDAQEAEKGKPAADKSDDKTPEAAAPVSTPTPAPAPVASSPDVSLMGRGAVEALKLAWDMAEDAVKALCPDLDSEALEIARTASGGSPLKYKQAAMKLQEKITAAKAGAPANKEVELRSKIVDKVFSGAPAGGDAAVVQGAPPKKASERLAEVMKDETRAGQALNLLIEAINEEKLLPGTFIR